METRAVICGGSESGKTSLARGISRGLWNARGLRCLAFDPWMKTRWPDHARAFREFVRWRHLVLNTSGFCVIWDDATANGGRDKENVGLFSEIRHRHPVLICITHLHSALLPQMRVNITDGFLADSSPEDADEWAKTLREPALRSAAGLPQYSFLHKRVYRPIQLLAHSSADLDRGVNPWA